MTSIYVHRGCIESTVVETGSCESIVSHSVNVNEVALKVTAEAAHIHPIIFLLFVLKNPIFYHEMTTFN